MRSEPQDEIPVVPRAFRELSRTGRLQRMLERIIAQRRAQSLYIGMRSDIHDLRDQPMPVPKSVFRGLPPDVLASKREQVHDAILHGRRPVSVLVSHRIPASRKPPGFRNTANPLAGTNSTESFQGLCCAGQATRAPSRRACPRTMTPSANTSHSIGDLIFAEANVRATVSGLGAPERQRAEMLELKFTGLPEG